jgi:hypothetical protein
MEPIGTRSNIPINLPASQREEATVLRNKLLKYRFDKRLTLGADPTLVDPQLSPRTNQLLVPLLSIIPSESARLEIRRAVASQEAQREQARSTTIEADLLDIVMALRAAQEERPVALADITACFIERCGREFDRPVTNRYVGSLLRGKLGLATFKSHGVYVLAYDAIRIANLAARYGLMEGA